MSQQRQAAARANGKRAARGAIRAQQPGYSVRTVVLLVIAAVVALSALGVGAAVVYDRTKGQPSALTQEEARATAVGGDSARALMVRRYLNEHFSDAPWYTSVIQYVGDGDSITLKTNLDNSPFGVSRAAKMCDAVSGYIYGEGRSEARFTEILVLSIRDELLVRRPNRNTVCTEVGT